MSQACALWWEGGSSLTRVQICCPLPFWTKRRLCACTFERPPTPPSSVKKCHCAVDRVRLEAALQLRQHSKSCLIVREGGRVSSPQRLCLISSACYVRKTWPASVQLHAPPLPPKSETGVVASYVSEPADSRLGHCPRRHFACEKPAVYGFLQSGAMGHKKGSWWTGNKKKKLWVCRRCDT